MQQLLTFRCMVILQIVPCLFHSGSAGGSAGGSACVRWTRNGYITAYGRSTIIQQALVPHSNMTYSPGTFLSSITFSVLLSYKRQVRFSGWRGGFVLAIFGSSFVLLFNIICAIVAAAAGNPQDGIATIYTGKCAFASRLTTGLQLLINILSSALLGASSYCLQQLGAPTRDEIDEAHGKGKWLHVGVLSLRNLPNISKRRQVVWLSLAISSIPLHFL